MLYLVVPLSEFYSTLCILVYQPIKVVKSEYSVAPSLQRFDISVNKNHVNF